MQVILTEEEYTILKEKADACNAATRRYTRLIAEHTELSSKYYKLLSHGVAVNNERLKTTNDSRLT